MDRFDSETKLFVCPRCGKTIIIAGASVIRSSDVCSECYYAGSNLGSTIIKGVQLNESKSRSLLTD
jgi:protein-arginine kinase activator protein McsA